MNRYCENGITFYLLLFKPETLSSHITSHIFMTLFVTNSLYFRQSSRTL